MTHSKVSWEQVRLGDILTYLDEQVELEDDKEYLTITVKRRHGGLEIRDKLFGREIKTKKQFRLIRGSFIISRIQCWHQAYAIVGDVAANVIASTNYDQFAISPEVHPRFFWWLSHTPDFTETVRSSASGVVIEKMVFNRNAWLEKTVLIPPLLEQERIVAQIEELADKINKAHALRQQAIEEAEVLYEVSVGSLMAQLDRHPKDRLGNHVSKIGSGSTPLGGRASYPTSGVPFIRSLNVRMRHFQWDNIAFISPETHAEMAATQVHANDVLLNITGASIGRVACAPKELQEGNVNQHVSIVRPDLTLEPRYLMYWLSQPRIQEFINDKQKGATRQGFTKAQIEAFNIPMAPISEQREIVAELDALQAEADVLKDLQAETAAELDALLPSILDRVFKGEL